MKSPKVHLKLLRRLSLFEETMKSLAANKYARGFHKPGSQNPRKR